ncbi:Actin-related protein 4 [Fusarium oxysporum f. sp. cubense race 1]|uniref:Actin-related protein 4 n=1 Tax=Fusarium oxysporum f. sp. cubense (strain race 1) TaxID=1229664 RepID=N4TUM6_FUSC1|nr:Actin-related protein 4 [Fusarium oxysporum f. sp. cubense race 1]
MAQQPLPTSMQPTDIYGGDEVSALVLDPGYCYTRAGFAGEDVPKSILPSFYGHTTGDNPKDLFGDECLIPRPDFEVRNYMNKDSVVEDWDVAARIWENMLVKRLQPERQTPPSKNGLNDDPKAEGQDGEGDVAMDDAEAVESAEKPLGENPLLITEAPWNTPKAREKAIEIIMENWGCPAFWLSRTPVLAAFAAGKATSLVIDVGGANTSVTAIHDGMVLKRSIQKSPVGGIWLSSQIRNLFEASEPKVELTPTFMIENKTPVDALAPPSVRLRHFPMWREQRFRVTEGMFDETVGYHGSDSEQLTKAQTIPELIRSALNAVDVDLRGNLLANVVVTGSTSLINGFNDRLNNELMAMYPGLKIKIHAAGLTSERRFGAWIGGSILASLGTFHQMWISRKEYEENGPNVVEKRCK